MNKYQFTTRRVRCVRCGARRGFAPLVGDEEHGKCHACGFFSVDGRTSAPVSEKSMSVHAPVSRTFSPAELAPYLYPVIDSNLVRGLLPTFTAIGLGDALIGQCQNFDVWSDCDNNAVFLYWNASERLVTVKTVPYDNTGHRIKELGARFGIKQRKGDWNNLRLWRLFTAKRGFRPCLYGEFQLSPSFVPSPEWWSPLNGTKRFLPESTQPICLVESEKTCIVASLFLPELTFLATGGATGLSDDKAKLIAGTNRPVIIVPDNDSSGRSGAEKSLHRLRSLHCVAHISNLTRPNDSQGDDLADAILNKLVGRAV